ncbi:MAG: efflux transporter outer membrane subunit [Parasphingopyxis sp.]|uniref:efflux transporter outer membrane subunit n=1 Tax=Parasphingopyxis sp. TaxID=1920299 RepID=UPI003F9FCE55
MIRYVLPVLAIGLAGCAAGPDYGGPPAVESVGTAQFDRAQAAPVSDGEPIAAWWTQLDDPLLDDLIRRAFEHNRDIEAARANLRASRAVLRGRGWDYFPTGGVDASYARQRFSEEAQQAGAPAGLNIPDRDFYDVGFDAIWEIDIFGRIGRANEAARADAQAVGATRDDLLVSVAAEVATAYVELRGAQQRLAVAERNASNQQDSYALTEVLLRGGRGTRLDTERARAQLETTLASIPPLRAEIDALIHRLGVLTGNGPTGLRGTLIDPQPLPELPRMVAIGDPSGLFRRRPDIRRAERELAAATARIGVAAADFFPTVSIVGDAGFQSTAIGSLLQGSAFAFTFGPQLIWNLLDFGRIDAAVDAEGARAEAAAARYEQTVLLAFEETENALTRYGNELQRRDRLAQARQSAREAARLARLRFDNGVDDFLTVLDAERVTLENEDRHVVSEIEVARQIIAIYKALGGGWEVSDEQDRQ